MLTVFPYSAKDQDQAVRLAEWIRELGPNKSHRVLIVRDRRCDLEHDKAILAALDQSFAAVETLTVNDDAYDSWPESANTMFRNAAKHIEFTKKEPFLWLEPDVAPLKEGWLDAIAAAYVEAVAAGKHFMGDRVEVENVPLHMSGIACYPGIMSNHAGLAYLAQDIAWDCAAASQIVPKAHFTNLIEHAWKHPSFTSWEMVEREIFAFKPDAVLFHADKSSGLIDRLRERRNLPVNRMMDLDAGKMADDGPKANNGHADENASHRAAGSGVLASQETGGNSIVCDIFIKTYPPDYPWLKYCLRSIAKFVSGVRRTEIVTPADVDRSWWDGSYFIDLHIDERMEYGMGNPQFDGYLSQQVFKLYADTLTDASFILFTDSDTIFTCPVTPETYFTNGKVNWMITPYAKTDTPWKPMIEKFLGRPVEFETMRRHPQMVPRWLLISMREFCEQQHGMPLDQYVMSQPYREFSEFNALGAFAYYWHNDRFNWINTEEVPAEQWPPLTVLQKYSHSGLTPEIEAEFEKILSESNDAPTWDELRTKTDKMLIRPSGVLAAFESATQTNGDPLLATLPQQVPWESKEQSLEEIRSLAARLREFCGQAAKVRAVREILHRSGVISLPYRMKKRKGWKKRR